MSSLLEEEEIVEGYLHPDADEDEGDLSEDLDGDVTSVDVTGRKKYTNKELEEAADALLREDANRELCRMCTEEAKKISLVPRKSIATGRLGQKSEPDSLPYGYETGHIEWQIQKDKEGNVLLDDAGDALYVGFPELRCHKGHRWYKGEGPRRNINGLNPILFETHLYNRRRREIQVKDGVPDPAYTMDRWNKRPTQGMYNRTHPLGRKVNTREQRAKNGASWYRAVIPVPLFFLHLNAIMIVIISIGLITWMIWNAKQNTRHTCESIMLTHLDEKQRKGGIDTMRQSIVKTLNVGRAKLTTPTKRKN